MNAREQAHLARKEADFLDVCAPYQEELADAKDAVRQARENGAAEQQAGATQRLEAAKTAINTFRHWARTMGSPRDPGPGSAVIRMGG